MLADRGTVLRMRALGGDVRRAQRLHSGRRMPQVEHHEIQRRGEGLIVQASKIRAS